LKWQWNDAEANQRTVTWQRRPHVHEQEIKQNAAQQQEKLLEQEEQIERHLSVEALSRNSKKSEPFFFLLIYI